MSKVGKQYGCTDKSLSDVSKYDGNMPSNNVLVDKLLIGNIKQKLGEGKIDLSKLPFNFLQF